MNEKKDIETCTAAVESSFSNGAVECHNLIVAEAMEKMLEDEKSEQEIALAWAIHAKNALQNHSGHSPNELVFEFKINTPTVLTDWLSALEAITTSDMVRLNLNALHAARKNFMKAESRKKIQRALRSNVRTDAYEGFVTSRSVYYRRLNCKGWCGPAKIFVKKGLCVLIRHRGTFYKMQSYHLMRKNKEFGSPRNEENKISSNEINEVLDEDDVII